MGDFAVEKDFAEEFGMLVVGKEAPGAEGGEEKRNPPPETGAFKRLPGVGDEAGGQEEVDDREEGDRALGESGGGDGEPEKDGDDGAGLGMVDDIGGGDPCDGEAGGDEHVGAGEVHEFGCHEGGEPHERGERGESRGGDCRDTMS